MMIFLVGLVVFLFEISDIDGCLAPFPVLKATWASSDSHRDFFYSQVLFPSIADQGATTFDGM